MKKIILTLFAIALVTMGSSVMAMSVSKVRTNARFLSDRMAYELNLTNAQYNDVYEINFDFIYNVRNIMDDVVRGNEVALDYYYLYLDIRNEDLHWVLSNSQYVHFMNAEYFYRPIYASGNSWDFRVYVHFGNHNYFYFGKPSRYRSYGGNIYNVNVHVSNYRGRYNHTVYNGHYSVRRDNVYINNRKSDFGVTTRPSTTTTRPGTSTGSSTSRPSTTTTRPSTGSSSVTRPSTGSSSTTTRPSTGSSSGSSSSVSRPSTGSSSSSSSTTTRPSTSSSSGSSSSVSRPSTGSSSSSSNSSSTTTRPSTGSSSSNSGSSSVSRSSTSSSSSSSGSSSVSRSSGSSSSSSSGSSRSTGSSSRR